MATRSVIVSEGGIVSTSPLVNRHRQLRGYASSRQAYDRRRRSTPLDALGVIFRDVVRRDPCSGCGARPPAHETNAADHIDPLEHGGLNVWENLTSLCRRCNASKKNTRLLAWLLTTSEDRHAPAEPAG
jgi:5-methylcytosine-specific restriction endonuclease McrA